MSLPEELGDAYIMKYVEGESIARKILRDDEYKNALKDLAFECGESIAKIHRADIRTSFLPRKSVSDQINEDHNTYVSFNHHYSFEYTGFSKNRIWKKMTPFHTLY